jgi:hypothetical protein
MNTQNVSMKAIASRIARRALLFVVFIVLTQVIAGMWSSTIDPAVTAELALHSVNGGYAENASVRAYHYFTNNALPALYVVGLILVLLPAVSGLHNKTKTAK